jgi:hypothetical protein
MNENNARAMIMIKNIERCLILFKTAICSVCYFFIQWTKIPISLK